MGFLRDTLGTFTRSRLGSVLDERLWKVEYLIETKLDQQACLLAAPLVQRARDSGPLKSLREAEFKVFSQWGEDGILQYLIHHLTIPVDTFVEFGVEDYAESNTRFLLMNDGWRGLVLDGSGENIRRMKARFGDLFVRHEFTAKEAFITAANINSLISEAGIHGDIGVLSVDVDGNDYWIWKAIDCISPRIVICEYNSVFGSRYPVTIPYDAGFDKTAGHYSNLYFGASLPALCQLAESKGYDFVGSNSAGNNAFFVRKDVSAGLPVLTAAEGYVPSRFRSSVDESGRLTHISGSARLTAIQGKEVLNIETGQLMRVEALMVDHP